ncbi:MAG: hypothetical protein M3680_24115 [Myxococcota bacterium]|nr:hypothetical protein [Myxococcota bacterium]
MRTTWPSTASGRTSIGVKSQMPVHPASRFAAATSAWGSPASVSASVPSAAAENAKIPAGPTSAHWISSPSPSRC